MLITRAGRFLGALRDAMDARDYRYDAPDISLPAVCDLAPFLPEPQHQGTLGSCSAHAGGTIISWLYPGYTASRLALYYWSRYLEHTQGTDNGVQLRSIMKTLANIGVAPEDEWPYDITKFDVPPPPSKAASEHKIIRYARLLSERDMLTAIAQRNPFALAIDLPEYFDDADIARHGIFRMPSGSVERIGRHAITIVGFDLNFKVNPDFIASGVDAALVTDVALKARNSWGPEWGINGHFWLPLAHAVNPSTGGDAWIGQKLISHITDPGGPMVGGIKIEGHFERRHA